MIGVIVATHGQVGAELLRAAEIILGPLERVVAVGFAVEDAAVDMEERLAGALAQVQGEGGVLILVDMFGGTPSNLSLPLLEAGRLEIVTGVNLPMLLHVGNARDGTALEELARQARSQGERNILIVSEIMDERG